MRIGVLGNGHVGLITCVSLAKLGHSVIGTDVDPRKMAMLQSGIVPFYEPGIEDPLIQVLSAGRLDFTSRASEAIDGAEVIFICVGTPPLPDGTVDLDAVDQAAHDIAHFSRGRVVVVQKSTVPIGTADRIKDIVARERVDDDLEIEVVSNPEFLREGKALEDALDPSRIVVGSTCEWALDTMRQVYGPLVKRGARLIETDPHTAELGKLASNAFLSIKISYANALARLCELSEANVSEVADIMGTDARIGRDFLNAGIGFGGYCLPKDLNALERLSSGFGYDFGLLREVARINDEALGAVVSKIRSVAGDLAGKRIALLGLAFKPNTDDVRGAPALALAQRLSELGATVAGYDPRAMSNAKSASPFIELAYDPYECVNGASCVVVCTEWEEFRSIDLAVLRRLMSHPALVDARNMFDAEEVAAVGLDYFPVGGAPIVSTGNDTRAVAWLERAS